MQILLKRAYDPAAEEDGFRVLSERLWPRGMSKGRARIDLWAKETAPSSELRRWYAHDETKWPEFQARYREELAASQELGTLVETLRGHGVVTLVYGSKSDLNSSVVLRQVLLEALGIADRSAVGPKTKTEGD